MPLFVGGFASSVFVTIPELDEFVPLMGGTPPKFSSYD
jgi:hypothetical protein